MASLRWVLTRDTFPALARRTRQLYVAFDDETSVGRVYSIEAGQQTRRWKWCVTAVRCPVDPAVRCPVDPAVPMTGEVPSREEAKPCVEEAYTETLRWTSRS